MRVDFGMPTLIEHDSIGESVALCGELGLRFVEINMNLPMYQTIRPRELARHDRVYFTLHLDENLDPISFNPAVADAYLGTALSAVRAAREAEMPVVNMHFPEGVHFSLPDGRVHLYDRYWDAVRERLRAFRDAMDAAAGGALHICVENTRFGVLARHREALDLLLESPAFQLTYDCGHDHLDGLRASEFYAARQDRVSHLHLHDASAKTAHLPLGAGEIDLPAIMARHRACRAVLETKDGPGLRTSANWLTERNYLP